MRTIERERVKDAAEIIGVRIGELAQALVHRGFAISGKPEVPCRYSREGIAALRPRNPNARGVCVGGWKGSDTILSVVWDDKASPEDIHKDFIILEE